MRVKVLCACLHPEFASRWCFIWCVKNISWWKCEKQQISAWLPAVHLVLQSTLLLPQAPTVLKWLWRQSSHSWQTNGNRETYTLRLCTGAADRNLMFHMYRVPMVLLSTSFSDKCKCRRRKYKFLALHFLLPLCQPTPDSMKFSLRHDLVDCLLLPSNELRPWRCSFLI